MRQVTVSAPRYVQVDGQDRLAATITADSREWEIWFRTADGPVAVGAEPFASAALLPAMRLGAPLNLTSPISARLLIGFDAIESRFAEWTSSVTKVPIQASPRSPSEPPPGQRRVASMFSGGVDSFFTLYEHLDEIDDLVFVHGFDIPLDRTGMRNRASHLFAEVSAGLGKRLVQVETNIRPFADRYGDWDMHMHGPAIASVAQLLASRYHTVYVPGERVFDADGRPLSGLSASNEQVNPLWGTETLQLVPHGHEHSRLEKIQRIGGHEPVRRALRVCYENHRGAYNCGECRKCLLNMAILRGTGHLDDVRTFEQALDLERLARMRQFRHRGVVRRRQYRRVTREALEATLALVEHNRSDAALARALRDCLDDVHYRGAWYLMRRVLGRSRRIGRAILKA